MPLLRDTRALQREAFGVDPLTLQGSALREYLVWNLHALMVEAAEATNRLAWKPWRTWDDDQVYAHSKRVRVEPEFEEEVIDCLHFVANVLVALGLDDIQLHDAWQRKANVNRVRQKHERMRREG